MRLIVVERPERWPFNVPGVEVVAAREYLTSERWSRLSRVSVLNFCRSYAENTTGYYVSLLALARAHRHLPAVSTLQGLRMDSVVRLASDELQERIQTSLSPLKSDRFDLSVYCGRSRTKRYAGLSRDLFRLFPVPFLRGRFVRAKGGSWSLESLRAIPASDVPDAHAPFVIESVERFYRRSSASGTSRDARYDMAILWTEDDPLAPSDASAIRRFIRAADRVGIRAETIGFDDFGLLELYDALFIRETTRIGHHTHRFALRAEAAGLIVIDDVDSIVRCSNKVYQAEVFHRIGIPTPPTMVVHAGNRAGVAERIGFPCVLKSPTGSFSVGTVKAETPAELDAALGDLLDESELVIAMVSGEPVTELERGAISWSNELALHVLEFKTNGPAPTLAGLSRQFHGEVLLANEVLSTLESKGGEGALLMPGGVHPWMEPERETRLWPHEYNDVYRAFDRIFGCSGHGWSNLQSTHVNLPFGDDEEFARLHAAIRVALPLIPALTAASPFLDGAVQPSLDARLEAYGANASLVPEVAGDVIPDPVSSEQEYRDRILEPLYRALEPHDPAGILRHEWVNARGSIARFQRGAIEIRLIDAQECPLADLTVVSLVVALVRALTEERWASVASLNGIETGRLAQLLRATTRVAHEATVDLPDLARAVGLGGSASSAGHVWQQIADRVAPDSVPGVYGSALERILARGPLAGRMVEAYRTGTSIRSIAGSLARCLAEDRLFDG